MVLTILLCHLLLLCNKLPQNFWHKIKIIMPIDSVRLGLWLLSVPKLNLGPWLGWPAWLECFKWLGAGLIQNVFFPMSLPTEMTRRLDLARTVDQRGYTWFFFVDWGSHRMKTQLSSGCVYRGSNWRDSGKGLM